jgi:hypothetical protein
MDNFVHQVGYNLGVGVILAMLGGMALKALARDRVVPVDEVEAYDDRGRGPAAARGESYDDRGSVEPTRREAMTPGGGRGVDRGVDREATEERVATRDRGPGDRPDGAGNGTYRRPEGEWAHREEVPADETRGDGLARDDRRRGERGGAVPADSVPANSVPADSVPADSVSAGSVHADEGRGDRVRDSELSAEGAPAEDAGERRGIRGRFSR